VNEAICDGIMKPHVWFSTMVCIVHMHAGRMIDTFLNFTGSLILFTWYLIIYQCSLTPWLLVYEHIVPGNQAKINDISVVLPPAKQIALESCSNPEKTQQVLKPATKKNFGFGFFVRDIISEVGFWPFWLILPGLEPNR